MLIPLDVVIFAVEPVVEVRVSAAEGTGGALLVCEADCALPASDDMLGIDVVTTDIDACKLGDADKVANVVVADDTIALDGISSSCLIAGSCGSAEAEIIDETLISKELITNVSFIVAIEL